jgi:putative membrane protein
MDVIGVLPPLQATLNSVAACLMIGAYFFIRRHNPNAHRVLMLGALLTSVIFLVSYFIYHQQVGYVPFTGQGIIRPVYFTILVTHILTAAIIVPLVLVTLFSAMRGRLTWHRRIARWTLPLWLYTSVTGIAVYVLAFQLYAD